MIELPELEVDLDLLQICTHIFSTQREPLSNGTKSMKLEFIIWTLWKCEWPACLFIRSFISKALSFSGRFSTPPSRGAVYTLPSDEKGSLKESSPAWHSFIRSSRPNPLRVCVDHSSSIHLSTALTKFNEIITKQIYSMAFWQFESRATVRVYVYKCSITITMEQKRIEMCTTRIDPGLRGGYVWNVMIWYDDMISSMAAGSSTEKTRTTNNKCDTARTETGSGKRKHENGKKKKPNR